MGRGELNTTRFYTKIGDGEVVRQDGWKMAGIYKLGSYVFANKWLV
jgi:hypothetical protein